MSTPELLSLILSCVPMRDLLLAAPLVSKTWRDITLTPVVQRALFLLPESLSSAEPMQNPILVEMFAPFFTEAAGHRSRWPGTPEAIMDMPWARAPDAFRRKDASWRRMLLTQPPARTMAVIETCHRRGGDTERRAILDLGRPLYMADLYDNTVPLIDRVSSSFHVRWHTDPERDVDLTVECVWTKQCRATGKRIIEKEFFSDAKVSTRNFSPELVDQVLDAVSVLKGDPFRIATCGVVCRQWLPRSRFHVFRYLWLAGLHLESLLALVETSSSPVMALIQVVDLAFTFGLSPFHPAYLARLANECVNLTSIKCEIDSDPQKAVPRDFFLDTCLPVLGSQCLSLTRFELHSTSADQVSLGTITHIFVSLPALENFDLATDGTIVPTGTLSNSFPARLENLDLGSALGVRHLFAWLLSLPVLPTLKSLQWLPGRHARRDWASLHAYSQRAGAGLQTLSLCSKHGWSSDGEPPAILRHATRLRVLRLSSESTARVLPILSGLTSHELRSIRISLRSKNRLDQIPYADIDQLLARPQFQRLEVFRLDEEDIGLSYLRPEFGTRRLMPLAHAWGILV
ncbi:hypothetical protein FB45DRAFT_1038857 [Roridomyces roridus]|uniref:F-box domain-containing protein n=1 Tax=Roridomyces roridus TaxID=1738132 RepID=A0AAD7B475_9AGAR|nr:hypothetical protein FB45DRAFT_1038857 [Roridomyces roridus]